LGGSAAGPQVGPVPGGGPVPTGIGTAVWQVPEGSAGGEYTLEVVSGDGSFPPERLPFVVRSFEAPRLDKKVVLDRKTYAPGQHGSALVEAARLGAGPAAGAAGRAALGRDGSRGGAQDGARAARGAARLPFGGAP